MREHRTKTICKLCDRPVKGHGYCDKHYQRFKKWGDPNKVGWPERKVCSVANCELMGHAHGLCSKHAQQMRRGKLFK